MFVHVVPVLQGAHAHLNLPCSGPYGARQPQQAAPARACQLHSTATVSASASSVIHMPPGPQPQQLPRHTALVPLLGQYMTGQLMAHAASSAPAATCGSPRAAWRGMVQASGDAHASVASPRQGGAGAATTTSSSSSSLSIEDSGLVVIQLPAAGAATSDAAAAAMPLGSDAPTPNSVGLRQPGDLARSHSSNSNALLVPPRDAPSSMAPAPRKPAAGPLGFLQWGTKAGGGSAHHHQQQQWWLGGPIGGTLYINPPVFDDDSTAQAAGAGAGAGGAITTSNRAAALQAAPAAALQVRPRAGAPATLPSAAGRVRSANPLAIMQRAQGGSSIMQWGSPIGGTLYINPQAPAADWHDGWGGGGGGSSAPRGGGGGGGGGSGGAASSSTAGRRAARAGGGGGGAYSSGGAAGRAGALPGGVMLPGVGLARVGVTLMAAVAAGSVVAAYALKDQQQSGSAGCASESSGRDAAEPPPATAATAAPSAPRPAPAGDAAAAVEGAGYHEWMVRRLSSTLGGFEAEQAMLRTELSVLASIQPPGAGGSAGGRQRLWRGIRALFGGGARRAGDGGDDGGDGGGEAAAAAAPLSAADVAVRAREIREQLESLDTLKAALRAELAEQQALLQQAQVAERKAMHQHQAVLVSR